MKEILLPKTVLLVSTRIDFLNTMDRLILIEDGKLREINKIDNVCLEQKENPESEKTIKFVKRNSEIEFPVEEKSLHTLKRYFSRVGNTIQIAVLMCFVGNEVFRFMLMRVLSFEIDSSGYCLRLMGFLASGILKNYVFVKQALEVNTKLQNSLLKNIVEREVGFWNLYNVFWS